MSIRSRQRRDEKIHAMSLFVKTGICRMIPSHLPIDVYNKIDAISLERVDKLAKEPHTAVISCEMNLK